MGACSRVARKNGRLFANAFLIALLLMACTRFSARGTELAVGSRARILQPTDIPLCLPGRLNYLSRQQVLSMRSQVAMREPQLLAQSYQPNPDVFGSIQDGRPWWGMAGSFVYGSGNRSIEGDAEESRFLLNPYLILAANSWSTEIWNADHLSAEELGRKDFPYCWMPSRLRWSPRECLVQVVYDVSDFNRRLESWSSRIKDKSPILDYSLVAYNARDFGYNYVSLDLSASKEVINAVKPAGAQPVTKIEQFIHNGGSSGFPGGCNNMSPAQAELDHFILNKLPARATYHLWKEKPSDARARPDLIVTLDFI